jgi:hypothetical protein
LQCRQFGLQRGAELRGAQRLFESRALAGVERPEEIARRERAELLERWQHHVPMVRQSFEKRQFDGHPLWRRMAERPRQLSSKLSSSSRNLT